MFPSPNSRDWKDTGATQGNRKSPNLGTVVHQFATPQARDFRTGQKNRWRGTDRKQNLNDQVGGQLSPDWVEWLMGWPLGWTDVRPMLTETFAAWQRTFRQELTG